jgi:hypothetical protein
MTPPFSHPVQWQQNIGLARQACARIFRDGGTPADALRVFKLADTDAPRDWAVVVDRIAQALSSSSMSVPASTRRAA